MKPALRQIWYSDGVVNEFNNRRVIVKQLDNKDFLMEFRKPSDDPSPRAIEEHEHGIHSVMLRISPEAAEALAMSLIGLMNRNVKHIQEEE